MLHTHIYIYKVTENFEATKTLGNYKTHTVKSCTANYSVGCEKAFPAPPPPPSVWDAEYKEV